jgi:hypothetical protein
VKPPFRAEGQRLFLVSEEILTGPKDDMPTFARWLNEDIPPDMHALRSRLQAMIMVSRGGSFTIGSKLKDPPAETPRESET